MKDNDLISDVLNEAPNRRSLLKKIGIASAALGAGAVAGGLKLEADPATPSYTDVLQFALNLEYLEAEFYSVATSGKTIDQFGIPVSGQGINGSTTGGSQVNFAGNTVFTGAVANQIANDERNHVLLLRTALASAPAINGSSMTGPIARPPINLNALNMGFANEAQFLTLARVFEDIGVSAYGGGVPYLVPGGASILQTAARILAVEAEHVANIRAQIAKLAVATTSLDNVDILPPPSGMYYFSVDPNSPASDANGALTAIRTPGQVLYLAYGNVAGVTSGGFFPMGVNGNLVTSTAHA
jgi:hypothetical protein